MGTFLTRIAQPSELFVTVEDTKKHLNVQTNADNDLIEGYIRAATRFAEERTGRTLLPTEFLLITDSFSRPIPLGTSPIGEVLAVTYRGASGTWDQVAEENWYTSPSMLGGVDFFFHSDYDYPELFEGPGNLRIRFTAGVLESGSESEASVPDPLDQLIVKVLVAHWYQNREPVRIGDLVGELPFSIKQMIDTRRIYL